MYSIHINYIFATSWFFCLFLPTSPFKAVCENEASETVNSRILCHKKKSQDNEDITMGLRQHKIKIVSRFTFGLNIHFRIEYIV